MESIVSSLLRFADSQPEALALIDKRGGFTYGEVSQRVKATAAWLYQSGVRTGDTVALSLSIAPENSLGSLQFFYALAYLGAIVLPLHVGVPIARMIGLVERFSARYWIDDHVLRPAARTSLLDPKRFTGSENAPVDGIPKRGDDSGRPFLYHFTSGTTGASKVVLFSAGQFSEWALSLSKPLGSTANDRQVPATPWTTKVGLRDMARILLVGGTFVNAAFPKTRQELAALIHNFGVTQLAASPWQLRRLLNSQTPPGTRLPPLRVLSVGGAPISPQELIASRESITPNIYVTYGANEIGMIACLRPEEPANMVGRVGKLIPLVEAQAVDNDHRPLPFGTVGNLRFRAPWMSRSYVGNETATGQSFFDGWFYPGDLGSIAADGYVVLRGRTDDIINFGGVKIAPGDIEPVLQQHPDVLDAAVIGVPDAMAGQAPIGFVVLRRPVSIADLSNFCAEHLDGSQLPVHFVVVHEIPRSPDGKILRDRLSAMHSSLSRRPGN